MEVSARLLRAFDWDNVEGVIRHEVAHQIVDEIFGYVDAPPHGEAFARACRMLGVPPDARWKPMPAATTAEPTLMRIRKLLALSGSDNPNEAAAALAKARALAARHDFDLREALGDKQPVSLQPLGRPYKRIPGWYWLVMSIVERCAFVQYVCRAIEDGAEVKKQMEVYGEVEHLQLADYVHEFLISRGERFWRRRREEGDLAGRLKGSYLKGLYAGVLARLAEGQADGEVRQAGLVARDDPRIEALFRRRNPHVRTVSRAMTARRDALRQGQADSDGLRVLPGVGDRSGVPRLQG